MRMSSRRSRILRRIAAALLGLLVAFGLAEIAVRVIASRAGRPHDTAHEREELERLAAGESQYSATFKGALPTLSEGKRDDPIGPESQALRMLHPFTGWATSPEMELTAHLVGADGNAGRDPTKFRVAILGGSVAAIFARLGNERFLAQLAADPKLKGRTPELLGFGRTGGKQPQQLMTVAWLFTLGVVPDVVLDLDGHNELAVAGENAERGTNPLYPSIPHWAALALVGGLDRQVIRTAGRELDLRDAIKSTAASALRFGFQRSELCSALVRRRIAALQAEQLRLHEDFFRALKESESSGVLRGPPFDADPEHVISQSVAAWERDSQMIDELCKARGVLYVHALQPALYDPQGKVPTERELASAQVVGVWKHDIEVGYPLLRDAGKRLSAAGVHFVDTSNVFAGADGDIYVDACHYDQRGNDILAERLAQEILALEP
jgi:hypothetical protein